MLPGWKWVRFMLYSAILLGSAVLMLFNGGVKL